MNTRTVRAVGVAVNALLPANVIYIWRFSYFWLDDFNNLFWVQRERGLSMLQYIVDPSSTFFRPFGMLFYWLLFRTFGLYAVPYHLVAWGLHITNVSLLYLLLRRIVGSRFAAATGALLFGFRANFTDIYWSFGFIFELVAALLMFVVLLIYSRKEKSYGTIAVIFALTVLAIKSKEMAITLPAVLIWYDICHKRPFDRKSLVLFSG